MRTKIAVVAASTLLGEVENSLAAAGPCNQRLLPVINKDGQLRGIITRNELRKFSAESDKQYYATVEEIAKPITAEAYPDETLRIIVNRMAEKGVTRMPVVERATRQLIGMISLKDLLKARTKHLEEERTREQIFSFRYFNPASELAKDPADAT